MIPEFAPNDVVFDRKVHGTRAESDAAQETPPPPCTSANRPSVRVRFP